MGHSSGLGPPVFTCLQYFGLSLQSYIRNGKKEQSPRQSVCSGTESCAFLGTSSSSLLSLPCSLSQIQTISLNRQNARGCSALLRNHGEEAICTLAVAEYKYFPQVKWLLPSPSIWQWCPKCSKVVMLLSPKALQSRVFQCRERWASLNQFGRQMTARPQNLIWAACEFEGELRLYFTSLAFTPLLLHTPRRLCHWALCGEEIWFGRGGGHALGTLDLGEPLAMGCSVQALWRSVHRPWGKATVVPPAPLWKTGCRSNGCHGLDAKIAMPDSLDCATREIKLDDPFWPENLATGKSSLTSLFPLM